MLETLRCPADHDELKALPIQEWRARTSALIRRGGPDMPGTETRNCGCGSTLMRVHDQAALDAYIDMVEREWAAPARATAPECAA